VCYHSTVDFLEGVVERITYYNAENGYTVLRLSARGLPADELATVVGSLPEITPGESLRLHGQWITSPQYGRQFKADKCEQVLPATVEGIRKYLGSGLIKGVGPVTAQRIVKKFGAETLAVLDQSPRRIREVLGIGPKRAAAIAQAWDEQKSTSNTATPPSIWCRPIRTASRTMCTASASRPPTRSRTIWVCRTTRRRAWPRASCTHSAR